MDDHNRDGRGVCAIDDVHMSEVSVATLLFIIIIIIGCCVNGLQYPPPVIPCWNHYRQMARRQRKRLEHGATRSQVQDAVVGDSAVKFSA